MKQLLRTLMLILIRIIGLPGAWRAARKAQATTPSAPRILLIRPDHLGDLVLTTPILHALKAHAQNASITMMVGPWSSEVVARHPAIDSLLPCQFPGFQRAPQKPLTPYILLFSIAQQLRRRHYDLAINLRPDFWWGAALLYLAHIPRRIGYAIAPGAPFLTQALLFTQPEMASISNLRLINAALKTLGCEPLEEPFTPEKYPLQFQPTAEEQHWVTARLIQESIEADAPIVVIHPGTGAAVKLWRVEAWSAIANALPALLAPLTSSTPIHIILTGSKNEQPMLAEIAQDMISPPLLLTEVSIGQLAALLQRAQLVLGVDSGPPHLAVAQGTPTLHIFGPTDPRIFGPWGNRLRHVVVASTHRCLDCSCIPCGRLDFRPTELLQHPCVRLITEQQVIEAITKIIQTQLMQSTNHP